MISLREMVAYIREDSASEKQAMLQRTVRNPDTNQDVTVQTALGYPKEHPARKAAARIYAQFANRGKARRFDTGTRSGSPPVFRGDYDDTPEGERLKFRKAGHKTGEWD